MAFTLLAHSTNSVNGGSTGTVDNTGANLNIAIVTQFTDKALQTPTDSYGNLYTLVDSVSYSDGLNIQQGIFFSSNPTVGSTQFWSTTGGSAGADVYGMSFSGAASSSPYDTPNQNGASLVSVGLSSFQPGAVTPSVANALLVSGLASLNINNQLLSGGWNTPDNHDSGVTGWVGGGSAWKPQSGGPTSENPTWVFTDNGTTTEVVSTIAVFLPPPAGDTLFAQACM